MWLSTLVEEKFLYDRLSGFKSVCCPTVLHSGIRISTGGIAIKGLWQWNLQWSFRVVRLSKKCQFTTHKTLHCWIYHQYFLGADKFIYSMLGLHTADWKIGMLQLTLEHSQARKFVARGGRNIARNWTSGSSKTSYIGNSLLLMQLIRQFKYIIFVSQFFSYVWQSFWSGLWKTNTHLQCLWVVMLLISLLVCLILGKCVWTGQ